MGTRRLHLFLCVQWYLSLLLVDNMKGKLPDDELLADLERVNDEVGGVATSREYRELGKRTDGAIIQRFGSWKEAQAKLGHDVRQGRKVTKEELLEDLAKVKEKLGRPPKTREYTEHGEHCYQSIHKHFGGMSEAQEQL